MTEPWIMVLLTVGVIGWILGGYRWKWIRRFLLPAVYAAIALISGESIPIAMGLCVAFVLVNSLSYGDRTPWTAKIAVFLALSAPSMIVDWKVYPAVLASGAAVSLSAFLTRRVSWFTHKVFEGFAGFAQASCLVMASLIP